MNDDVEKTLVRLTPRGAPGALRSHVLDAVTRELAVGRLTRWERRLGLAVAACLVLAVGLNVWATQRAQRHLARLYGPPAIPRQIAEVVEAVESVAGAEVGRAFQKQLLAARRAKPAELPAIAQNYVRMLQELGMIEKEGPHEKAEADPEMDRHSGRRTDRHTTDRQRDLGVDHRCTA